MNQPIVSPTGMFEVSVSAWEARMSLWVESPAIVDTTSGKVLFSFQDGNWSLNAATWLSDAVVELRLRKYPGGHEPPEVILTIDCIAKTAQFQNEQLASLRDVEPALDQALTWPHAIDNRPAAGILGLVQRLLSPRRG
jgi:hypothetical protein